MEKAENSLVVREVGLPANMQAEITKALQQRKALNQLFEELLEPKVDFDRIPGTNKPTLLKAGAELLCQVFHLAPGKVDMIDKTEDYDKGLLSYVVGVPLVQRETGELIAYGVGSANSKEPKYRYRNGGTDSNGDKIKIENPDPAEQQNTLLKMASKRALIDGVLKATGASRKFTQDLEDLMPPEKASSKQINMIRSLAKGVAEAVLVEKVSELISRELNKLDEIYRNEASAVINSFKENPPIPAKSDKKASGKNGAADSSKMAQVVVLARDLGHSNQDMADLIKGRYEVESSKQLSDDQVVDLIAFLSSELDKKIAAEMEAAVDEEPIEFGDD